MTYFNIFIDFFFFKFVSSLDDEPEHGICHSKPPLPILRNNTMAFEAKRKLSRHRKRNPTRGVKPAGSSQAEANNNGGKDMNVSQPVESTRSDDDSNWSNSLDEDYIIFSFREDGNFEVLNNDKTNEPSTNHLDHTMSRNSRPVNRKVSKFSPTFINIYSDTWNIFKVNNVVFLSFFFFFFFFFLKFFFFFFAYDFCKNSLIMKGIPKQC